MDLIVEGGTRTSMMSVGKRAQYSQTLIISRFRSKSGLIRAVTREVQYQFKQRIAAGLVSKCGLASIKAIIDAMFTMDENDVIGKAFYVLLGEALGADLDIREAFMEADKTYRNYVERMLRIAQANGEIDHNVSPSAIAVLLVGMFRGAVMQWRVNPDAFDREEVRREAHSLLDRLTWKRSEESRAGSSLVDGQEMLSKGEVTGKVE